MYVYFHTVREFVYSLIGYFQHIGDHEPILLPKSLTPLCLQQILVAEVCQRDKVDEAQRGEEQSTLQRYAIGGIGYLPQTAACQTHWTNGTGKREVAAATCCRCTSCSCCCCCCCSSSCLGSCICNRSCCRRCCCSICHKAFAVPSMMHLQILLELFFLLLVMSCIVAVVVVGFTTCCLMPGRLAERGLSSSSSWCVSLSFDLLRLQNVSFLQLQCGGRQRMREMEWEGERERVQVSIMFPI